MIRKKKKKRNSSATLKFGYKRNLKIQKKRKDFLIEPTDEIIIWIVARAHGAPSIGCRWRQWRGGEEGIGQRRGTNMQTDRHDSIRDRRQDSTS